MPGWAGWTRLSLLGPSRRGASPTLHCPVPPLDLGRHQQSKTQTRVQASDELALLARRHLLRVLSRAGVAHGLRNAESAPRSREWLKGWQSEHRGQQCAVRRVRMHIPDKSSG